MRASRVRVGWMAVLCLCLPGCGLLIDAVESPAQKFPSRKKALAVLQKLRQALVAAQAAGGGGHFEVDL